MKKHFLIAALGAIFSLLLSSYLVENKPENGAFFSISTFIFIVLLGVFAAYLIYFITVKLDQLLPWQTQTGNRLFVGVLLQFTAVFLLAIAAFYTYIKYYFTNVSFFIVYKQLLIKLGILIFICMLLYSIVYFALYSYYSFVTLQIESVKQERKQLNLQLNALKSQLSPHFLFNSLNTISSLVHNSSYKTEKFIRRLAKLYEYTLASYHVKLVSLEEELAFVNSYLYLIHTRFNGMLTTTVTIPNEVLLTKIPPLTLQMLIENAVKHNTMSAKNQLKIDVFVENNLLCVQNNITASPKKVNSFHIGLKNINARYLLLANKGIYISNGQTFTVKLPLIA